MDHFAGMDVSVKETGVCILDDAGKILKEVKVASEPQALLKVLGNPTYHFERIGLEAGHCRTAQRPDQPGRRYGHCALSTSQTSRADRKTRQGKRGKTVAEIID
jgi:hypothetical protein